jgi:hypothetical protein
VTVVSDFFLFTHSGNVEDRAFEPTIPYITLPVSDTSAA